MLKAYYQISTYKKNEKLKKKYPKKLSKSFVKGFLQDLYCLIASTGTVLGTSGTTINGGGASLLYCLEYAGDSHNLNYYGIQVGTGTNAVSVIDYSLQSIIPHGNTTGKLENLSSWCSNLVIDGSTGSFDMEKLFYNSSGGSITIEELGLYHPVGGGNYCSIRDVLGVSHVEVLDTEYLKVKYTIQITA